MMMLLPVILACHMRILTVVLLKHVQVMTFYVQVRALMQGMHSLITGLIMTAQLKYTKSTSSHEYTIF